ncbi:hypothetical protein FJZ31_14520 [Candidatus Poribacteria bacterium]|nr:hypothetical protein [Candidatus Poribacteria bacterium]
MQMRNNKQRLPYILLIGIILIAVNSFWMMRASLSNAGYPTTVSLYFNVVFYLFWLVVLNLFIRKFFPKNALTQQELISIYLMLTVASALNGLDMLQILLPVIAGPYILATAENEWRELFFGYIPQWLVNSDQNSLKTYSEGGSSLYLENLRPWLMPWFSWGVFTFALVLCILCLTIILSRRWTVEEKLSYPIIQLPLEMSNEKTSFFRHGNLWIGFLIGFGMAAINGLHFFFPAVPTIGRPFNVGQYFTQKPWNAMGWLPVAVQPFAIGLGFFMPVDLSFSCWFFYLFWKFERIIASVLGLVSLPGFPYIDEQSSGAYIGLALVAVFMARKHLFTVFKLCLRPKSEEKKKYQIAFTGLILGTLIIIIFCSQAGMSFKLVALFFPLYFLLSIAIGRIRAELGSPVHDLHFAGPDLIISSVFGTRGFSKSGLTVMSFFWFFNRAYRSHPMPCILEGFKLGERTQANELKLSLFVVVATVVSIITGIFAYLHFAYRLGGKVGYAYEPFNRLAHWLKFPVEPGIAKGTAFFSGIGTVALLMVMRVRFIWWPFHPVGYAVSSSWAMNPFWFSIFISWLIKSIILRTAGLKVYRSNIPLFLGLILGEFLADSIVSIAGTLKGVSTYIWYS